MWTWVGTLTAGQASFLGTVTASALGLMALLIGALFNAHLNRRRDDRLRNDEARTIGTAIRAELNAIVLTLNRNAEGLREPEGNFVLPDLAHSVRVFPALLPKLGLLPVVITMQVIDAYVSIDQYCENLLLMGGRIQEGRSDRRLILMPPERAADVAQMNTNLAAMIMPVIEGLRILRLDQ